MNREKRVIADVFSVVSKRYDIFLKGITLGRIDRWQEELLELLGEVEDLLDVGTGTGGVLEKARMSKLRVGIDISHAMLMKAREKCRDCYFLLADAEAMPFKERTFHAITSSLVYRHLLNRPAFLEEACRVLREGGKIAILDINRFFLTSALAFFMKSVIKPIGILIFGKDKWDFFIHSLENCLSIEEIDMEMERAGFTKNRELKRMMGLVYLLVYEKVKPLQE